MQAGPESTCGFLTGMSSDAYFAALAIESGAEWVTADHDYARFPGLRWSHPLGWFFHNPAFSPPAEAALPGQDSVRRIDIGSENRPCGRVGLRPDSSCLFWGLR